MSIYTRSGDTGSTSLFGGKRVLKCEELVEVYGSLDELNSWVGHIAALFPSQDVKQFLQAIQSDLFTIGSTMAGWKNGDLAGLDGRVKEMEARIDAMEKGLSPIRNFILPGGAQLAAHAHITRSICRRVERQTVALAQKQEIDKRIVKYLNRLSDLFFMLARFINKQENVEEIVWQGIEKSDQSDQ